MLGPGAWKLPLLCEPISALSSHGDRTVAAGGSQPFFSTGTGEGRSPSVRACLKTLERGANWLVRLSPPSGKVSAKKTVLGCASQGLGGG